MTSQLLIVEPNRKLQQPFAAIDPKQWTVTRVANLAALELALGQQQFDVVMLSCSFSAQKSLAILQLLNQQQLKRAVALVLVVDLNQRYSLVLGTKWAKQIGILSSESTAAEVNTTLARFLSQDSIYHRE